MRGTQRAEDENVSEIPSAFWGGFFVDGFTLGIHSPDPDPDFSVSLLAFVNLNRAVRAKARVRLTAARGPE